jgi:hypothetical protein
MPPVTVEEFYRANWELFSNDLSCRKDRDLAKAEPSALVKEFLQSQRLPLQDLNIPKDAEMAFSRENQRIYFVLEPVDSNTLWWLGHIRPTRMPIVIRPGEIKSDNGRFSHPCIPTEAEIKHLQQGLHEYFEALSKDVNCHTPGFLRKLEEIAAGAIKRAQKTLDEVNRLADSTGIRIVD